MPQTFQHIAFLEAHDDGLHDRKTLLIRTAHSRHTNTHTHRTPYHYWQPGVQNLTSCNWEAFDLFVCVCCSQTIHRTVHDNNVGYFAGWLCFQLLLMYYCWCGRLFCWSSSATTAAASTAKHPRLANFEPTILFVRALMNAQTNSEIIQVIHAVACVSAWYAFEHIHLTKINTFSIYYLLFWFRKCSGESST